MTTAADPLAFFDDAERISDRIDAAAQSIRRADYESLRAAWREFYDALFDLRELIRARERELAALRAQVNQ